MTPPDPLLLATAVEAVQKAGAIQMAHFGGPMRIDKKGAIDLVTEVDVAVERMFRALVAERFPDHVVLGEELQQDDLRPRDRRRATAGCSTRSTARPTSRTACQSSVRRSVSNSTARRSSPPSTTRRGASCSPRSGDRGPGSTACRCACRHTADSVIDSLLVTGFPYTVPPEIGDEMVGLFGHFLGRSRAVRRLGSAALDLCYVAAGRLEASRSRTLKPWDSCAGALIVEEAGGRGDRLAGRAVSVARLAAGAGDQRPHPRRDAGR